jgi:hypothetical protein
MILREKSMEVWLRQIATLLHDMRRQGHHLFHVLGVAAFSLEDQVACRESLFLMSWMKEGGEKVCI